MPVWPLKKYILLCQQKKPAIIASLPNKKGNWESHFNIFYTIDINCFMSDDL